MQIHCQDDLQTWYGDPIKLRPLALMRLLIMPFCSGVVKIYKLTYEHGAISHARYNNATTLNRWSVDPQILREISDYFGPKTEHLDWGPENGKVTFTSYTEKITDGKGIIPQVCQRVSG